MASSGLPISSSMLAVLTMMAGAPIIAAAQIAFTDESVSSGVAYTGESFGASFGDLNGDGYLEIFASNHRTQPSLFLNRGNRTFVNVATQTEPWLLKPTADTHGSSWFDFDNDGDQDLAVGVGTGNLQHFLVNEYGRLVDRTVEAGLDQWLKGNRLPLWLDYDGDRLPDLVWANHGGIARLFRQDSPGHFTDQTEATRFVCLRTHYGHLLDVTDDGRLDYMCPNIEQFPLRIWDTEPFPWLKLFDNQVPDSLVIKFPLVPAVVDSTLADFDNDGRLDMFLLSNSQLETSSVVQGASPTHFEAQLVGGNKGFRFVTSGMVTFNPDWNRADEGTAVQMARYKIGAGGGEPDGLPFELDPADPDVAGIWPAPTTSEELPMMRIGFDPATRQWTLVLHTQLESGAYNFSEAYLQVDSTQAITNLVGTSLWATDNPGRPTLLMNETGGYVDRTVAAGLDAPIQCGSVTTGDFDNDMDVDLYLACRTGASNIPNILYENLGNGTFRVVPGAGGAEGPQGLAVADGAGTADSVIAGDYDRDGFLDLFVTNGLNLRPRGTGGPNKLFRNRGNANNWIEVDLIGTQSERDAVGARVYAKTANGPEQLRVQNGAYHRWSQDSRRAHFGLAGASTVDLRVVWPNGIAQTFDDVAANLLYSITQGSSGTGLTVSSDKALAYQCGPPALDGAVDAGVFLWRDCPSGEWRLKTAAAGGAVTYSGAITSTDGFTSVRGMGLGSRDSVDASTNPNHLVFAFATTGTGTRGVNFIVPDGADTCLQITAPAGTPVFYGPFRTPITPPFNLETQVPCQDDYVPVPAGSIVFDSATASVAEAAGAAVLRVSRTGGSSGAVSVSYSTSTGSASAGTDFTMSTGTLSWADGDDSAKTISVSVANDTSQESSESFVVTLATPTGGATLGASSATVTINDDDTSIPSNDDNDGGGGGGGGGGLGGCSVVGLAILGLRSRRRKAD